MKPFAARHNDDTYLIIHITELDILEAVKNININKTPGHGKVAPRILKDVKEEISHPLLIIIKESLRQGKIPTSGSMPT